MAFPLSKQSRLNNRLLKAAAQGNTEEITRLLDLGADKEARSSYWTWKQTPLGRAAMLGQTAAVKLLLERGAKIDVRDETGDTPLRCATFCSRRETAEALLQLGADPDITNNKGHNARHAAGTHEMKGLFDPPAPAPVKAPDNNPDEVVIRRLLGGRLLEEIFNFQSRERISLLHRDAEGPVEAMTRESFDAIADKAALRRAYDDHLRRGGAAAESDIFPNVLAKTARLPSGEPGNAPASKISGPQESP